MPVDSSGVPATQDGAGHEENVVTGAVHGRFFIFEGIDTHIKINLVGHVSSFLPMSFSSKPFSQ
jgi:hypothetical protein